MKKIIVTVRQFRPSYNPEQWDVDSRMYHEDLTPILDPREGRENFHMGQISSSLNWAVQDIPDHFKTELDEMFPEGYEFEFYYIPLYVVQAEAEKWWEEMSYEEREKESADLSDEDAWDGKLRSYLEDRWINKQMVHKVIKLFRPVDLNNIVA